ncbi:hypothetical protein COLO4_23292 [Corchorus olitorius]|uniref:Uncharacterized protein n=1 Tax=Corchorus olitorius TaxID=93759 RepID=A0A1R3IHI5_9ROSI|nr:hypothetical protein COLO4_23292 [Corchorus olitorius]
MDLKNGSKRTLYCKPLIIGCAVYKSIFLISSSLLLIIHSGDNKGRVRSLESG